MRDGRNLKRVGQLELRQAVLGVAIQQLFQNRAGLHPVLGQEGGLLLAEAGGALAAGPHGPLEGQVTEQIEGIGCGLLGDAPQLSEKNARSRRRASTSARRDGAAHAARSVS